MAEDNLELNLDNNVIFINGSETHYLKTVSDAILADKDLMQSFQAHTTTLEKMQTGSLESPDMEIPIGFIVDIFSNPSVSDNIKGNLCSSVMDTTTNIISAAKASSDAIKIYAEGDGDPRKGRLAASFERYNTVLDKFEKQIVALNQINDLAKSRDFELKDDTVWSQRVLDMAKKYKDLVTDAYEIMKKSLTQEEKDRDKKVSEQIDQLLGISKRGPSDPNSTSSMD